MWRRLLNTIVPASKRAGVFEPFVREEYSHAVGCATLKLKASDARVGPALMHSGDSTGFGVWGSALVLARLLEGDPEQRRRLAGAAVLELGSGTGLVGMVCGVLGARAVTLTDRVVEHSVCSHGPFSCPAHF